MTETAASVFGDEATNTPTKIPDEIVQNLIALRDEFGLDRDTVKNDYVGKINDPRVEAQGEAKWVVALRALHAYYNSAYSTYGKSFLFQPFAVNNRPQKDEKKGGFKIRVFGVIRSAEPELEFEGPAEVLFTGFAQDTAAISFAGGIRSGTVYKIRANPSSSSPAGKITGGTAGFLFADGSQKLEPITTTEPFWTNSLSNLMSAYSTSPVAEVLVNPKPNVTYRIEAELVRGRVGINEKDKSPNGSVVLADDSVVGDIAKGSQGGLFMYLPRDYTSIATLAVGSRIEALINGYFKTGQNKEGQATGGGTWRFNVLAMRVVVDLTPGNAIPNADKPAVSIPEAPKIPVMRL